MVVSAGTKLGPYEILAPIGKGGMGQVWKARDTRLGRDVAIKISSEQFSERFEREAHAVAALNHPHICTLYDVGPDYLVMEYIEGTPLKGPLPVEKAVEYSGQILDALDAAHRKGITHRDLKPANILVTRQGIKLLDFGLAKQAVRLGEDEPTKALTDQGQIIGTLQYMSPEQLQGKEADARSDLFSFGCVLYEMLSGKRAFEGNSSASVIAAIIERPAPSVAQVAPPALDHVLKSCLEKDPENRWQNARDLKLALKWTAESGSEGPTYSKSRRLVWSGWSLATVAILATTTLGFLHFRESNEDPHPIQTSILPPEKAVYVTGSLPSISPDGRRVAFTVSVQGQTGIWIRDLDASAARLLPGTEGAYYTFWSPNGRFVGFSAGRKLKKVDTSTGAVSTLCDIASNFRGGAWSRDDIILFTRSAMDGLYRVPAAGGQPVLATTPNGALQETSDRFPWFLPDGHHFLFTGVAQNAAKDTVYVGDLESKERRPLLQAASNAVYASPGYILFVREQTLMAQPFDASSVKLRGDAVPIAEQVNYLTGAIEGDFSASQNGLLIYRSGGFIGTPLQLSWLDRSGKTTGVVGAPASIVFAAVAPAGNIVAASMNGPQTEKRDIWLYDLARGSATRFTLNSRQNDNLAWSPDGAAIAFRNWYAGVVNVSIKATNGNGPEEILDDTPGDKAPLDWSKDGRYLVVGRQSPKNDGDIWLFPRFGDRKPIPYLRTEFNERAAKISPNGQWLAYASDETKRYEVYVSTFPTAEGKWQISTSGMLIGSAPVWSRDGKELYFISAEANKMMAVEIKPGAKFEASAPQPLFDVPRGASAHFDVGKDGRFLLALPAEQVVPAPMTLVVNWQVMLKK